MKKLFSLVFLTCMAGCGDEESLGDARVQLANANVPNIETSPQTMHGLGDSKPQFADSTDDINGHPSHSLRDHVIPPFSARSAESEALAHLPAVTETEFGTADDVADNLDNAEARQAEDARRAEPVARDQNRIEADQAGRNDMPNIILIFADDLGYGHLGAYGQRDIRTPNLDRLANEGVKFTQFYSGAPWCPPARTSLMTGLHTGHTPNRNGGHFSEDAHLLPRSIKEAGYRTALFGKWGLNSHQNGEDIRGPSPMALGFDEFTGFITHRDAHVYFLDGTAADGPNPVYQKLYQGRNGQLEKLDVGPNRYLPDEFLDRALNFIEANQNQPFFLYFPSQLPHAELVAPPGGLGPYAVNGQSIFPETPFAGNRTYPEPVSQPYATLAAMITRFDQDVGRIIDKVDQLGLGRNTLIIVTSDNGPHEAGGIVHAGLLNGSGNLDGRKFQLYEGGIRVPMLARWTGTAPAGHTVTEPHALWDLAPTLRDIAGAPARPTDGVSLVQKLRGQNGPNHDELYWETYIGMSLSSRSGELRQRAALRMGDHKIMRIEENGTHPYVLVFDIAGDAPDESFDANLARGLDHCDLVRDLTRRLNASHTPVPGLPFPPLREICQLLGSEDDDTMNGTPGDERIVGRAGHDTLNGREGNDVVAGGMGDDLINGNQGQDFVQGNPGNDIVHGGKDDDIVHGGKDNDQVYGDLGNDEVYGDLGDDQVYGGEGDDQVYGGDGNDLLNGNQGRDFVQGNAGNDTVHGGKDDDTVRGGKDNDRVYGDLGNDIIYGDLGDDILFGGAGNDVFVYRGGDGRDVIHPDGDGHDTLRCENTRIVGERQEGNDTILAMDGGGEIRLVGQASGSTIDRFEGCR